MGKKSKEPRHLLVQEADDEERVCELGVCVGYSCRKAGSKDVRGALDREIWRRRLDGRICVRTVGCLDRCDEGPSVGLNGTRQVLTRVRQGDAARVIDRCLGAVGKRSGEPTKGERTSR